MPPKIGSIDSQPSYPTARVKHVIAHEGETLRQLAERTGVPADVIAKHNRNKEQNPDAPLARGVAFVIPLDKPEAPKAPIARNPDGTPVDGLKGLLVPKQAEHAEPAKAAKPAAAPPPAPDAGKGSASADAAMAKAQLHRRPAHEEAAPKAATATARHVEPAAAANEPSRKPRPAAAGPNGNAVVEAMDEFGKGAQSDLKKVGAGKDGLELADGLVKDGLKALGVVESGVVDGGRLASVTSSTSRTVADLTAKLEGTSHRVKACLQEMSDCKDIGRFNQLRDKLVDLQNAEKGVSSGLNAAQKELALLQKAGDMLTKEAKAAHGLGEVMDKAKNIGGRAFQCLAPLEIASNLVEFEQSNPGHFGQNLLKATSAFAGKFALGSPDQVAKLFGTAESKVMGGAMKGQLGKLGPAEAAVGLMKFGLEMAGLKDTPQYDSLDMVSQAFPTDVIAKGLGAGVDFAFAAKDLAMGDASGMDRLMDANMKGKNGQVLQGLQVLTDLMMTGGQNIPTDAESIKFSQYFVNEGNPNVPPGVGRNTREKTAMVRQLMEGADTAPGDVVKLQSVIAHSTPAQLEAILSKVNPWDLARSLPAGGGQTFNPAATTFTDMARIAGFANRGDPHAAVWNQLDSYVKSLQAAGDQQSMQAIREQLDAGHLKQIPGWLKQTIRWETGG